MRFYTIMIEALEVTSIKANEHFEVLTETLKSLEAKTAAAIIV